MRFESVTAHAFGPFDGQSLTFAPGLNVIFGPNEAGKSSWHAALYVGLCGIRRGRGAGGSEAQAFRDRHRPWQGSAWEVQTVVSLGDDRRVELRHDLDGKVACRATDTVLGRDISDEIISDGAPDGSRWLKLDRRSFLSTACVRQADLLSIQNDQDLQQHLQRAAATAGSDATAAEALKRIEDFRRDHVGLDRANATRPLRAGQVRVAQARHDLERAQAAQAEYHRLAHNLERLEAASRQAESELARTRAAEAEYASGREESLERARAQLEHDRRAAAQTSSAAQSRAALLGAGVCLAAGLVLLAVLQQPLGLLLALVGGGALAWLAWRGAEKARRNESRVAAAQRALDAAAEKRPPTGRLQVAEEVALAARNELERGRGQLEERTRSLPSLAEAEEALAGAEAELSLVRRLDATLQRTREFLLAAQDRVHRDIAPVLAGSVRRWLPAVTAGRYTEVAIDPSSLKVSVRDGSGFWQNATLLSHGTAQQVYLLFRAALAEHLTGPNEVCPLLLDDVTVQSDAQREIALLETLHTISKDRQVIVFSQEEAVLAWAKGNLDPSRDRLERLPNPPPGPSSALPSR